jgi:glutamate dehydrogenase/leucine dehydrogenase
MGAKVVGIIDRVGGLIKEDGFSHQEITELFLNKDGNTLRSKELIPFEEVNDRIWKIKTEIFAPCAASRLISQDQIDQMISSGLEVISCGANVPFADKEIFFGSIMEHTDEQVSLIPDFISNCGMARVFAYFMERRVQMTDEAIFNDTSRTIRDAIQNTFNINSSKKQISSTAFEIALKQLV